MNEGNGGLGAAVDPDVRVEEVESDIVDVAGLSGAADEAGWTTPIPNFLRNGLLELSEAMAWPLVGSNAMVVAQGK